MVAKWWRTIADLCRGQAQVIGAHRLLRRARRLRARGEAAQAFRLAVEAFALLRSDPHREDPAARAIVATDAVLLDQLAGDLGHARATRDDLMAALRICEDAARTSPGLAGMLQEYVDWYRHRLAEGDDVTVH
jgi:hypothetical protein